MEREERRDQILLVATRLFAERPYSEVSVNDIAEQAGIARGLMHHHFGSKRDLYLEVVRAASQVPEVSVDASAPGATWSAAVDGFLAAIENHPDMWMNAVNVGGAERDDEVAAILDATREILADQTLAAIGLADRADDPVVRAFMRAWGGFVQELTVEWIGRERLDLDRVRTAMIATLPILVEQVLPLIDRPST
ncbi:MAG: helix-turn-helix domain-containing protein [Ilumatobacteraceae bacterium]